MPKIFDSHSHYIPPEVAKNTAFFKVFWSDAEAQLKSMDAHGIEKALLLYPSTDAHLNMGGWGNVCRIYNEGVAAVVKKHKDRFVGAGIVPVDNAQALKEELKRIEGLGLKAISIASSYEGKYLDGEIFFPAWEFAGEKNFPIHVHPQIINPIGEDRVRDPLLSPVLEYVFDVSMCIGKMMMEGTFLKFPKVKFIFAHYGGVLPFVKERFDNTYQMLLKRNFVKDLSKLPSEYFKNLYFDVSGSKSPAALACALELADAGHVLWGSDYPANQNIGESIGVLVVSPLTAEQKNLIFCENFQRIFA
ncbi:MAG TPA: amidohydrolase family protein [Candidatus Omnitrophota bacterium]|nr:amidohydrolase family protein [Candidatus Omnitrophota bacterium]HPD85510.1 amidohydrolase family protein [Candidatus Omnitrophota bacterium]HRZ04450.1 amidohydrolase family protein [Candidatus Omnitrophota bacterium]